MYFRRPWNKILKIRPALGQMKFSRYSHTSLSRQFVLLKCYELRNTKSPTFSRNFAVGKGKENESKTRKTSSRLDLMAPHFRSNYSSLKFTPKNRKGVDDEIQTMSPKSLTLKMCRQPSNNLSTFHTSSGTFGSPGLSEDKTVKEEEVDRTKMKTKADFCRHICGPCSSKFTLETVASKPPSDHKTSKRIVEKLTEAEIKEICETRCPCKESHVSRAQQNLESQSTTLTTKFQTSPTTIQSTAKLQDLSAGTMEGPTNYFGKIFSSTNTGKFRSASRRNRQTRPTNNRLPLVNSSSQTNKIYPSTCHLKQEVNFIRNSAGSVHPMEPVQIRSFNKPKSKYARMIRSKQTNSCPTQVILPKYRIHPRQTFRIDPRQTCRIKPPQAHRQTSHIGPFPYDLTRTRNIARVRPTLLPAFHTQLRPNTSPCAKFVKNGCHFEQFKPVPFRYVPMYPKNYHSDPVMGNRFARFHPMQERMPYQPLNLSQRYEWQNSQINSPVFGSKNGRNRQMLGIQSKVFKMIPNPTALVADPVHINNVSIDRTKGTAFSLSAIEKVQPKDSASGDIETLQQSRRIMSKLVENLTVVVDSPGKLKLTTSPYPKMRDENDVIIQMEYVNLTDADARHYLTGKYNPYSYATTVVGRTGSGIIIETGQNVHDVKPGDKVFVKPISCGKCSLCLSDHRNLCEYVTASELYPIVGVLSRLHVHSAEFVTKIPHNVSVFDGAMTWTLSTAIRACQKASVTAGDVVLVIGGGALGMATSLAAQLLGATTVCLADIRKPILDNAENFGIEEVFQIDPRSPSKNTAIKLWEQMSVYPRVTFNCTGSQLSNEIAINATQTGGKVVVMTNSGSDVPLPISNLVTRDIDVIISTCGNDESDTAALRFLSTKKILFESYLHKHYDLSNADEAFEDLHDPNRFHSHIVVKCGCACGKWAGGSENKESS